MPQTSEPFDREYIAQRLVDYYKHEWDGPKPEFPDREQQLFIISLSMRLAISLELVKHFTEGFLELYSSDAELPVPKFERDEYTGDVVPIDDDG